MRAAESGRSLTGLLGIKQLHKFIVAVVPDNL